MPGGIATKTCRLIPRRQNAYGNYGQISIAGRRGTGPRNEALLFTNHSEDWHQRDCKFMYLRWCYFWLCSEQFSNALILMILTTNLKSLGVRAVWVQVPLRLPWETKNNQSNKQCRETTERWFFCICNSRINCTYSPDDLDLINSFYVRVLGQNIVT